MHAVHAWEKETRAQTPVRLPTMGTYRRDQPARDESQLSSSAFDANPSDLPCRHSLECRLLTQARPWIRLIGRVPTCGLAGILS